MTSIDDELTGSDTPFYTQQRPMLWGTFNLSKSAIPFYQTVLSLEEVASELKLVENLPSDLRSKWRLEELFQREIDWERVRHSIFDGYLRRPEKLKFFNSLTVALLPLNQSRMLAHEYGDTPNRPETKEAYSKAPWSVNDVGGVQLITNSTSPHGYIRWDPKRIFPATIDGQHRLAALQMLYNEGNLPSSALNTKISVIFLVVDPRVGFDIGKLQLADGENPILTVVREVFIDLNKHAQEVARSRRILLDDQEIESRCLRNILASRVGEEEEGKLPLGLVHWQHNVTAKFNTGKPTGPFVTTVELLYSIIVDLLDLKRPKDPLDESQVRKFVNSIETAFGVSDAITNNPLKYPDLKPLMNYVEKMHLSEGFEVPFVNLPSPYLRVCVDRFQEKWAPLLIGVLTNIKAYKMFIEVVREKGGLNGDLAFFLVQPRKAQDQQSKEWGEEKLNIIDKPLEELAKLKTADWPFFAVFQKGMLRATSKAWAHFGVVRDGQDGDMKLFLQMWVSFLDDLSDRGLLTVKSPLGTSTSDQLWAGISLNPASATIRWSESAVQRICAMILLWWYFYSSGMRQTGRFIKAISSSRSNEKFPLAKDSAREIQKGLRAVILSRTTGELSETEITGQLEKRLRLLIDQARNDSIIELPDDPVSIEDSTAEIESVDEDSEIDSNEESN